MLVNISGPAVINDFVVWTAAMDFAGQKLAEFLLVRILVAFGIVGFVVGYATSNFNLMALINAVGFIITVLLVVPDWPWFNRNPLPWLEPLNPDPSLIKKK